MYKTLKHIIDVLVNDYLDVNSDFIEDDDKLRGYLLATGLTPYERAIVTEIVNGEDK